MSLDHDFALAPAGALDAPWDEGVRLHDDVLTYLWDTLQWLPTRNPSMGQAPGFGLSRWGLTAIDAEGAPAAARLFRAWAALLACGPARFQVTTGYAWTEDDGAFVRTEIDRDAVVRTLETLARYADEAAKGEQVLLHRGI
jgi:hypothetical protein